MDTLKATRWVVRLGLPVLIVSLALLWWSYGVLTVPAGMDTMPRTHPPGSVCLIRKHPGAVAEGAVVFVDVPDGGTVLTRVLDVRPDGSFEIRHDNRDSVFTYLEASGPYPLSAVRGLVLSSIALEAQGEPARAH